MRIRKGLVTNAKPLQARNVPNLIPLLRSPSAFNIDGDAMMLDEERLPAVVAVEAVAAPSG